MYAMPVSQTTRRITLCNNPYWEVIFASPDVPCTREEIAFIHLLAHSIVEDGEQRFVCLFLDRNGWFQSIRAEMDVAEKYLLDIQTAKCSILTDLIECSLTQEERQAWELALPR